jgi:hypothetical protein
VIVRGRDMTGRGRDCDLFPVPALVHETDSWRIHASVR